MKASKARFADVAAAAPAHGWPCADRVHFIPQALERIACPDSA
jgi:hypothetical protein